MNIRIIDADLITRNKHRFPNLACEKISGFHKRNGDRVTLITSYDGFRLEEYDEVYVSKVFTNTAVPEWLTDRDYLKRNPKIHIGGTGFFYDNAPNLPAKIEHSMPDYDLYNVWIQQQIENEKEEKGDAFNEKAFKRQFAEYTDYSIGFLTRGCFRKCDFCVNKKYDHVFAHSPLNEFYDPERAKICLLDDNFFGCPKWREMLRELIAIGKPYKFKQGLDERLLTREKCEMIFNSKYDGDITFRFDSIKDYELIKSKLPTIKEFAGKRHIKFYVLVGFESTDHHDIENMFKRIELLMQYDFLPYIMRYQSETGEAWKESKYRRLYTAVARWCNQPSIFRKKTFREFCEMDQTAIKNGGVCRSMTALKEFEKEYPAIAERYFDLKVELMKG